MEYGHRHVETGPKERIHGNSSQVAGREPAIFAQRNRKLAEARLARQRRRQGQVVAAEGSRNTQRENACQEVEFSS